MKLNALRDFRPSPNAAAWAAARHLGLAQRRFPAASRNWKGTGRGAVRAPRGAAHAGRRPSCAAPPPVYPLVEARCWTVPWISTSARRARAASGSRSCSTIPASSSWATAGAGEIAARTGRRPLDHHVHHPQGRGRTGPAVREAWPARAEAGDAGAIRADLPDGAAQFGPADDAAGPWLRYRAAGHAPGNQGPGELPAPPVCIVQRTGLPLTPAAEHYCTLRAPPGTSGSGSARWRPGNRRQEVQAARVQRRQRSGRIHRLAVVAQLEIQADLCCRYCPFRRSSGPGSRAALP